MYYTASGIITSIGGRLVHRLRESSLTLCTGRSPTECDDTRDDTEMHGQQNIKKVEITVFRYVTSCILVDEHYRL